MNYEHFDLNIKTISPVHIGSGNSYNASEYFRDNLKGIDVIKRISVSKYFNSLNPSEQKKFIEKVQNKNFRISKLPTSFNRYLAYDRCDSKPSPAKLINENIKVFDKPYIPGSSIKGAIKTALLYNALSYEDICKISEEGRINKNVYKTIFSPSGLANDDILRFLNVTDSSVLNNPSVYDVDSIKPSKEGPEKVITTYLETIFSKKKKLYSSIFSSFDESIYEDLDFTDEQKKMLDINYIKKAIFNFSKDYIKNEIIFSEEHDLLDLNEFYLNLAENNSKKSPLMRIGSGSGFLAVTIGLKVKNSNFAIFNDIKRKSFRKTSKIDFPITRKIVKNTAQAPGWIQLSFI